ncbi:MAG: hypothetical protein QXJ53_01280 [Candidatus Bathyarchaeia archaeon]
MPNSAMLNITYIHCDIITDADEVIRFRNIPRTTVQFDPYRIAVWKLESDKKTIDIIDRDIKIALDYVKLDSHEVMQKYALKIP